MAAKLELNELPGFPRCIEIQTVSACNARCEVCPYATTTALESKTIMQSALVLRLLEECAAHSEEMDLIIPYFNNEPFADRRMIEFLRYISQRVRIPVEISTNLSLVTDQISRLLIEENLIQTLRVSVFGAYEETYERRMRPLRWSTLVKNLTSLLIARRESNSAMSVEIIMVGTPDLSPGEVAHARELWETMGARVKIFGYLDRAGNNSTVNLLPLHQGFGRIRACELNRPFERMAIRATGECVLCSQDWRGEVVLGNVSLSSLEKIWQGAMASEVRSYISGAMLAPQEFLCRRCKLAILD